MDNGMSVNVFEREKERARERARDSIQSNGNDKLYRYMLSNAMMAR